MNPPGELMCAVCQRPRDVLTDEDGDVKDYWHASGISYGADHDPVPVARVEEVARLVCDFCSQPGGTWRYPARTFATPNLPAGHYAVARQLDTTVEPRSIGDWMACADCHDDIERNLWGKLAKRCVRSQPPMLRPLMLSAIMRLHAEFRKNRTGPPIDLRSQR